MNDFEDDAVDRRRMLKIAVVVMIVAVSPVLIDLVARLLAWPFIWLIERHPHQPMYRIKIIVLFCVTELSLASLIFTEAFKRAVDKVYDWTAVWIDR